MPENDNAERFVKRLDAHRSPEQREKYRRYFSRCSGERCASNRLTNRSALSFSGILDLPFSVTNEPFPPESTAGRESGGALPR